MHTKGIEVTLTSQNFNYAQFKWASTINFSIYNQEITKLQSTPMAYDLIAGTGGNVEGYPRNSLFSYRFTGLNNQGLPSFVQAPGIADLMAGANFLADTNLTQYLKYEGSVEPNKSIGFSNTFSYGNLSLNIFIVATGGNRLRLAPTYGVGYSDMTQFTKEFSDRWLVPGDEKYTTLPVIVDYRMMFNYAKNQIDLSKAYTTYNFSDERTVDGSFVRLKNVSLTYEFSKELKKRLGLTTFNMKGVATNPLLLYSDKKLHGQDPEFFRSGGVSMPITNQYTFAINLSF
jgi:hypothetical protein